MGNDTLAAMAKKIAELEAANASLKQAVQAKGALKLKVSEKGALSIYGMGKFPVTLYKAQWERLLEEGQVATIKAFISANEGAFSTKADLKAGAVTGTLDSSVGAVGGTSGTGDSATAPKALPFDRETGKTILPSGKAF